MRIEKPWGFEELLEVNYAYAVKRLTMFAGHRCSLQFHRLKRETIVILSGELLIEQGSSRSELQSRVFRAGESLTIEPGVVHRMSGVSESSYLEASTVELDDVVRLEDDYRRIP